MNSKKFGNTSSMIGQSSTISFVMLTTFDILVVIYCIGFINWLKESTILLSITFTAPISIILFTIGFIPVVSKSNTT